MTLPLPRIAPLADEEMTEAHKEVLAHSIKNRPYVPNVSRTLARNPRMYKRLQAYLAYIMDSNLSGRDREILILRIGWLCRSDYEWTQHSRLALKLKVLSEEDLEAIKVGAEAPGWTPAEQLLITATDEQYRDQVISDTTWQALAESYDELQMMDIVITIGQYWMFSAMLRSFGVQIEDNVAN